MVVIVPELIMPPQTGRSSPAPQDAGLYGNSGQLENSRMTDMAVSMVRRISRAEDVLGKNAPRAPGGHDAIFAPDQRRLQGDGDL